MTATTLDVPDVSKFGMRHFYKEIPLTLGLWVRVRVRLGPDSEWDSLDGSSPVLLLIYVNTLSTVLAAPCSRPLPPQLEPTEHADPRIPASVLNWNRKKRSQMQSSPRAGIPFAGHCLLFGGSKRCWFNEAQAGQAGQFLGPSFPTRSEWILSFESEIQRWLTWPGKCWNSGNRADSSYVRQESRFVG